MRMPVKSPAVLAPGGIERSTPSPRRGCGRVGWLDHSSLVQAGEQGNKEERMDVLEAIASKRAVRHFTDQPISDEDLRAILNAGRRAQSSKNTQPWTFIAILDRQALQRLSECGAYAGHLAGA